MLLVLCDEKHRKRRKINFCSVKLFKKNCLLAAVLNVVITDSVEVTIDFLSFWINVVVSMSFAKVVVGVDDDSAKYDAERNALFAPRAELLTILEKTFSASGLLLRMFKSIGSHSGCGPECVPKTVPACFNVCVRSGSDIKPSSKLAGPP